MEEAGKSARFPKTGVFPITKDLLKRSCDLSHRAKN
jgi:hypothetical protein